TPAAQAGFQAGDRLLSVDGKPVDSWLQARWAFMDALSSGGELEVGVKNQLGQEQNRYLTLPAGEILPDGQDLMAKAGLVLRPARSIVQEVFKDSAAEQAGLQENDLIIRLDDLVEPGITVFVQKVQQSAGKTLELEVLREGEIQRLLLTPEGD